MRIVFKVRDALSVEVPVRQLFDAPTVAFFSAAIEGLLGQRSSSALSPNLKLPRPAPVPLSLNQEQMWRIEQIIPRTHFFNMPYVYRIRGELNIAALEKSIEEIVRRHESLRTVFGEVNGCPNQIIKPAREFRLRVIDLRKWSADKSSDRAARLILEEKRKPFNLSKGPLFRTALIRLTNEENFLLLTSHHIILDFWSVQVLRSQLRSIYEALSRGLSPDLPEPQIQFADYAIWERKQLEEHRFDQQIQYWKEQLALPLNKLNLVKTRRAAKSVLIKTNRIAFEVDEGLLAAIKSAACQEKVTPFAIVLSALNIALYHWTRQTDIRVGVLVANRGHSVSQDVMGNFVNTVIIRNNVDGRMTFRQFLKQVESGFYSALSNQELPFAHVVRVVTNVNKISRSDLFQVQLSYQSASGAPTELSGTTFASLGWRSRRSTSEFMLTACDMAFNLRETETTLTGTVNVSSSFFEPGKATRNLQGFIRLLHYVVKNVEASISSTLDVLHD
jgi:hypothetical protein